MISPEHRQKINDALRRRSESLGKLWMSSTKSIVETAPITGLKLSEVKTKDQVEWLRVQRNEPVQYKYFRQDKPITPEQQASWWRHLDKTKVKLFIVEKDNEKIGYVGLNPLNRYASNAEFGIFIIEKHQGKGYAEIALKALLKHGFEDLSLSTIYSDVLDYPGENRWGFYEKIGFMKRENYIPKYYMKQGRKIYSIPFYINRDNWNKISND